MRLEQVLVFIKAGSSPLHSLQFSFNSPHTAAVSLLLVATSQRPASPWVLIPPTSLVTPSCKSSYVTHWDSFFCLCGKTSWPCARQQHWLLEELHVHRQRKAQAVHIPALNREHCCNTERQGLPLPWKHPSLQGFSLTTNLFNYTCPFLSLYVPIKATDCYSNTCQHKSTLIS